MSGGYHYILEPGPVITGVTNPFFDSMYENPVPFYPAFNAVNFSVELTDYYTAPQTGLYQFSFKVDDAGIVFFGAGAAFDCCSQTTSYDSVDATIINQYDAAAPTIREIYLEAGKAYPIKMYYVNALLFAEFLMSVKLPDGSIDSNIGTSVYSSTENLVPDCNIIPPISVDFTMIFYYYHFYFSNISFDINKFEGSYYL